MITLGVFWKEAEALAYSLLAVKNRPTGAEIGAYEIRFIFCQIPCFPGFFLDLDLSIGLSSNQKMFSGHKLLCFDIHVASV